MKTVTISRGNGVDYVAMQDNETEVTAVKVDKENVATFSAGISLGVLGDIDDADVQEMIRTKLYPDKNSD